MALTGAAFVGSTVSGVFGMAGGMLLLAIMMLLGLEPLIAVPVHAAVQLVSNGTRTYAHLQHVRWPAVGVFMLAALPGPLWGMRLAAYLDPALVKAILGVLILITVWLPKGRLERLKEGFAFSAAGFLAGSLGVVIGAVGPLVAPFFLRPEYTKRNIIATKAVCQAGVHMLKICAFAGLYPLLLITAAQERHLDFNFAAHLNLIGPMAMVTVGGTYLGKWILSRIPHERFILGYRVLLTVLALRLIISLL